MTTAQADSPLSNAARGQAVVLQMARLGDLAQTLPLLWNLSQNQFVKLICDYQVLDWAKLLPGVDELVFLNTQIWRRRCSGGRSGPRAVRGGHAH